jgi:hypothetical protein
VLSTSLIERRDDAVSEFRAVTGCEREFSLGGRRGVDWYF